MSRHYATVGTCSYCRAKIAYLTRAFGAERLYKLKRCKDCGAHIGTPVPKPPKTKADGGEVRK
jgi:hypothetical protein